MKLHYEHLYSPCRKGEACEKCNYWTRDHVNPELGECSYDVGELLGHPVAVAAPKIVTAWSWCGGCKVSKERLLSY